MGKEAFTLEAIQSSLKYISRDILKFGIQDEFNAIDYYEFEPHRLRGGVNPLQGTWSGHCSRRDGEETITFLVRLSFRLSPDRKALLGKGEDYASTFNFGGSAVRSRSGYDFQIPGKLDMLALFRKLDTPREKDMQRFIESRGGAKACISNDEALEELIVRSGELSVARIAGKDNGRKSNDLPGIRKRLFKELQEDIDETFNRNMVLFERKLEMQNKQLTDALHEESSHIISTLLSGAHDRIIDPVRLARPSEE